MTAPTLRKAAATHHVTKHLAIRPHTNRDLASSTVWKAHGDRRRAEGLDDCLTIRAAKPSANIGDREVVGHAYGNARCARFGTTNRRHARRRRRQGTRWEEVPGNRTCPDCSAIKRTSDDRRRLRRRQPKSYRPGFTIGARLRYFTQSRYALAHFLRCAGYRHSSAGFGAGSSAKTTVRPSQPTFGRSAGPTSWASRPSSNVAHIPFARCRVPIPPREMLRQRLQHRRSLLCVNFPASRRDEVQKTILESSCGPFE